MTIELQDAWKNYCSKKHDTLERLEAWYSYCDIRDGLPTGTHKSKRIMKTGLYDNLYDLSQLPSVKKYFYDQEN